MVIIDHARLVEVDLREHEITRDNQALSRMPPPFRHTDTRASFRGRGHIDDSVPAELRARPIDKAGVKEARQAVVSAVKRSADERGYSQQAAHTTLA
jgi:hypothetical protein